MEIQQYLFKEPVKSSITNERQEVLKFFVENIKDKNGKQYSPKFLAIKLSHIPTKDLYYMISIYKDTEKRRGSIGAQKEFWWSLKANPTLVIK